MCDLKMFLFRKISVPKNPVSLSVERKRGEGHRRKKQLRTGGLVPACRAEVLESSRITFYVGNGQWLVEIGGYLNHLLVCFHLTWE